MKTIYILLLLSATLSAQVLFTEITADAGITQEVSGEGATVIDFNNDGLDDIFVPNHNGNNLLYKNLGGMQFVEVGVSAGIAEGGRSRLGLAADYDNDGDQDLFVGNFNEACVLYLNNGDETFSDVTAEAGISNNDDVRSSAWCDVNSDGWLDLYVTNFGNPNQFYINNGDGTFSNEAATINATGPTGLGLVMSSVFFDYDRDNDADLLMTQDGFFGNILLNQATDGNFLNATAGSGVNVPSQGMGIAIGDYDRDGWFDFNITNLSENTFFRNNGDGTFGESAASVGVTDTVSSMGWGTFFFDADNDGWLDLYNNNQTGFGQRPNTFYYNNGDGTFSDLSAPSGLESWNDGLGAAYADFDNDGDLDIFLAGKPISYTTSLLLFRNDSAPDSNWIQFKLSGSTNNANGVGAILEFFAPDGQQLSYVSAGSGYCSQNTLVRHFGLGNEARVDSLIVTWPSGVRTFIDGSWFSINNRYTVGEDGVATSIETNSDATPKAFSLRPNYPNPFNPQTTIQFDLNRGSQVTLDIFSITGQLITQLINERLAAGTHAFAWQPAASVSSGVYLYRLRTDDGRSATRKMIYIR